jgi:putative membrane protein
MASMTPEARPAESASPPLADGHATTAPVEAKKTSSEAPPNLALMNTLMAADRTLMAWIRTSLSLLSFGFTIYKVLQGFQDVTGKFVVKTDVPRNAGLFLTGMGTFAMVMGTIEYWQTLRTLHQPRVFQHPRAPLIMAFIMSLMGCFLFFSITSRIL